ncbi:MAG: site-specific DNA-methyltransferase [Gemmatimonas sp.]|jgi:adenine-specific DNA-methyltransferase|uniref:site-specific DNA-methyltransferase n=1 Tax=Gemmatimonas sp. TaxID=1962908 RepID=UPI0025BDAB26|nr:site-specific DNA-methyltransferase [Gemmatimonas sp.]MCE2953331.1 site-specific DNA-methyltransferase [Gemmatimonas sp.]
MTRSQKLELTWVGKDERPRLEPRILVEDATLSYHASARVSANDQFDNLLIHGDNLLALKALQQQHAGTIKCVYIDPPFNTGQAFEHYDDGVEHSLYLSLMRDRLEILRSLLASDGTIFLHCDDYEQAYLKVLMDEIFGRDCFRFTFTWQSADSPSDNKVPVASDHDFILCYTREPGIHSFKPLSAPGVLDAYSNRDEHGRLYRDRLLRKNGKNSLRTDRPSMWFEIRAPDGTSVWPIHDDGREACWALGKAEVFRRLNSNEIIWKERKKKDKVNWIPYTREYAPENPTRPHPTIWRELQTTRQAKQHLTALLGASNQFATPKPEPLVARILEICTSPGDLVLDSFLGSGTTAAVAHKMGRRWIGIELGEHAVTHCVPRLRKVVDGADPGGITEQTNWKGGGGFRFLRLAPSLLERDHWGNWVVSREYNAAMLAEAVCKLEGFRYEPNPQVFWQQGKSTEQDYLYVTTQTLDVRQLEWLSESVGPDRSLKVLCRAWLGSEESWPNLTLKKIPNAVLGRCEFGCDDYSLRIASLPAAPESEGEETDSTAPSAATPNTTPARRKGRARKSDAAPADTQTDLLSGSDA